MLIADQIENCIIKNNRSAINLLSDIIKIVGHPIKDENVARSVNVMLETTCYHVQRAAILLIQGIFCYSFNVSIITYICYNFRI